jgi:transposase
MHDDVLLRSRGKPAKVAIMAIMRKLLILANALIRDRRKWVPANP